MSRRFSSRASGWLALSSAVIALWGATSHAQPLITCNNASAGGGPITTYDFSTGAVVGSFTPDGALPVSSLNNGRGVLVLGNKVYYTELTEGGFGATDAIRIAPFNGGAGGSDIGSIPNPRPDVGVQDLAFSNGVLYALTGYPSDPLEVFGLDPVTGAVVSGPVSIAAPAAPASDGLAILPNGNFLINEGDDVCAYDQYNPTTGALIPGTTIIPPGCTGPFGPGTGTTGVETDGTSLFFETNFDSFTRTQFDGTLITTTDVAANTCEDISLVNAVCFGVPGVIPGTPNCHGKCVSFLAKTYGGISDAATDFGYASVKDLQDAIKAFCGSPSSSGHRHH